MKEAFFEDDMFYEEIEDYLHEWGIESIEDLNEKYPDGWSIEVEVAELRPIFQFTPELLLNMIENEFGYYMPEDCDPVYGIIENRLPHWFNFDLANSEIPEAWYGTGKKQTITKQDLIDAL